MIKKLFLEKEENHILEGITLLFLIGVFLLLLDNLAYDSGLIRVISFFAIQLFFLFIVSTLVEEIYLNYKKVHSWVLLLTIIVVSSIIMSLILGFQLFNLVFVILMSYLLIHRVHRVKKSFKKRKK